MPTLSLPVFSGLSPRTSDRLLHDSGATVASNCSLTSGEIRPLRRPKLVHHPETGAGPYLAAYRAEWQGAEKWRLWNEDVDCAVAPLDQDVEQRYYWTGDGEPRYAKFTDFGTTDRAVGIPTPTTKSSVSSTGGTGAAVTRLYCVSFYSQDYEESGLGPASDPVTGKVDDTWTISGFSAAPANSGTGTATGQVFTDTLPHWLRVGDEVTISSIVRSVTAVNGLTFTVDGADITGATSWARVANWNTTGLQQRLYRSAGTNATWQLVAERAVATGDWTDELSDADIMGDEAISDGWKPLPAKLKGLAALANGSMVGFSGNQVYFTEPFQPHAYKDDYVYSTDFEVVGLAVFGTAVVVATAGNPYIMDGVEPGSVTPTKVSSVWPCLSKRSVIPFGNGVVYATSQGLAYVGLDGVSLWTQAFFTQTEWAPLNPATMRCGVSNGRVFVRYQADDATPALLVFYPNEQSALVTAAVECDALYVDPRNGELYLLDDAGAHQWDAEEGQYLTYTWQSKEFYLPTPGNFGAGQVEFDSGFSEADELAAEAAYQVDIATNEADIAAGDFGFEFGEAVISDVAVGGDTLLEPRIPNLGACTFTLFVDGIERISRLVFSDEPFRLPAGYKGREVVVQVAGNVDVKAIKVADTMLALKAI